MQAIDVVKRYMNKFEFALFDGSIYKKCPEAVYTYVHTATVHDFIHYAMGNPEIANEIVSFVSVIINLLSEKSCRLISQISIDYNYIEVQLRDWCFNIEKNASDLKGNFHQVLYVFIVIAFFFF